MRVSFASLFAVCATTALAQNVTTIPQLLGDLAYVDRDTRNLTTQLSGPVNSDTVMDIELAALNLTSILAMTAIAAQALPDIVAETDQVRVLQAIESLYPDVIDSLAAYVPNAQKLDKLIGEGFPEQIIQGFQNSSNSLAAALIARATGPYVAIGKELAQDINNAFDSALKRVVPVAVPLPNIPPAGGSTTTSSSGGIMTPTSTVTATPVTSTASGIVSPIISSVPIYTTYPVYGHTTECTTAPVYGTSSVPVYGGGSAPVYGGSSAPVYGGSSAPVYGGGSAPTAPVYGGGSAPTAPVYGGSTVPVQSSGPSATGPMPNTFTGAAGRNVAQLGAAIMAAGVAVLV